MRVWWRATSIANSAECVVSAHCYDAMVGLHHCDKNGPGFAMALARMNYPGLILSGGSILPGCHRGKDVTILDVYDSQAAASVGALPQAEADEIRRVACPGPGGCGIAASFNTWGLALESIGLMPPQSSSIPATDPAKRQDGLAAGPLVLNLLQQEIRPRDILTRQAFSNAAATIAAAGGSTNAVLHLLALAREAGVDFALRDLQTLFRKTPVLCSFAPRGTKTMVDLHKLGGTSVLLRHLLRRDSRRPVSDRDGTLPRRQCRRCSGRPCGSGVNRTGRSPVQILRRHANLFRQSRPRWYCFQSVEPLRASLSRPGALFH